VSWVASPDTSSAVLQCARIFKCSPFALHAAVFSVALGWWTGQDAIVTTTDRANRSGSAVETIGLFADVAPLSVALRPFERIRAIVHALQRQLAEAQRPDAPHFADMLDQRAPGALARYDEIFPVAIALEEEDDAARRHGSLLVQTREIGSGELSRDLVIVATKRGAQLAVNCQYRPWKLERVEVERLARAIEAVYRFIVAHPHASVGECFSRLEPI
jgi:non-ribosomal peptide synthetase component F